MGEGDDSQAGRSSDWSKDRAEQPSRRSDHNSNFTRSNTQPARQCHTTQWPVVRYVEFHIKPPFEQRLNDYTPGNNPEEDRDQAEQPGGAEQESRQKTRLTNDGREETELNISADQRKTKLTE